MKKLTIILCLAALSTAFSSCSRKTISDTEESSVMTTPAVTAQAETTEIPVTTAEETTAPPKKAVESDFYGKWETEQMKKDEEIFSGYYNDIALKYVYQLEIREDGTASIGSGLPEGESGEYNWVFKNGNIQLKNESGKSVYCSILEDTLILKDGEGIKLYMTHTNSFETMDDITYSILTESESDISVPELSVEEDIANIEDYVGKWECVSYDNAGVKYEKEMYSIPLNVIFQTEIFSDNTARINIGGTDDDAIITDYTWEFNDNGCLELYEDDELFATANIKNNNLIIDSNIETAKYVKVDKFTEYNWNSVDY